MAGAAKRPSRPEYDAVVVGAGPNGLSAAITLGRAGCKVLVVEAHPRIGGGTRTLELTLPGFLHDICSTIHPLGVASPFFRSLPLAELGLEWVFPPAEVAHPLDHGDAVMLRRSLHATAAGLGQDAGAYESLVGPLAEHWQPILADFLGPLPIPPRHPFLAVLFGLPSLLPARRLANALFKGERARALFAGLAGHSMLTMDTWGSAGFGTMMAMLGHAIGWPVARRGSERIADALAAYLKQLGGEIITGWPVKSIEELPPARLTLFDLTPRQVVQIAGERLPGNYRRALGRYRYGVGVFKLDWALSGPIPWKNPEVARAATVHLGGTFEEVAAAEAAVWRGETPERPFVLLAQESLFDPSRAPAGKQVAWGYCHVPNNSPVDMTGRIEAQVERFAPGFRDCILARRAHGPADMELYNPNYIGGDINGGVQDLRQFFTRPVARWVPYSMPVKGLYICSSSTPPGGGVHGMCGYHAARAALKTL